MRFPALTGGPLSDDYELWQYHAHWGKEDSLGSEHKVNGQSYAGEVLLYTRFVKTLYVPTFMKYFFSFTWYIGIDRNILRQMLRLAMVTV